MNLHHRAGKGIKHVRLVQEGRLWVLGPGLRQFESIPDLVAYYATNPLYRRTRYAVPLIAMWAYVLPHAMWTATVVLMLRLLRGRLLHSVNKESMVDSSANTSDLYMQTYIAPNYIDMAATTV